MRRTGWLVVKQEVEVVVVKDFAGQQGNCERERYRPCCSLHLFYLERGSAIKPHFGESTAHIHIHPPTLDHQNYRTRPAQPDLVCAGRPPRQIVRNRGRFAMVGPHRAEAADKLPAESVGPKRIASPAAGVAAPVS